MLRNFSSRHILCQPTFPAEKFGYSSDFRGILLKMLHLCNIWCTTGIGAKSSACKGSEVFFLWLLVLEKNKLGQKCNILSRYDYWFLFL